MQSQILTAADFGIELFQGLGEEIHIVRSVRLAGPVKLVFPFHGCPPHGVHRICIAVIDLIREGIVLIPVGRPVIKAQFGAESGIITGVVICSVQIGGITVLRERMFLIHLKEYVQIIILIVDGRVTQLFVIVPADNIAAGTGLIIETDTVVSYFGREKIESSPFIAQLFEHVIGQPGISLQEIRTILLQIRICIQRHSVFQDRGEVFVGGDNIRQITAGQSGSVILC